MHKSIVYPASLPLGHQLPHIFLTLHVVVTFAEDDSRIRSGESAENMAVLQAVALNLLQQDASKSSLRQKRFRAAMDNDFLLHLLTQV